MRNKNHTFRESIRIIWAIALKDIVDAVKNRTTVTIMLGTALLMLSSQALPFLLQFQDLPKAYAYDPGESANIETLAEERSAFRIYRLPSVEAVMNDLVEAPDVRLGLVIPVDFDHLVNSGEHIEIQGFIVHWASQDQVNELVSFFESQFSEQVGVQVNIQMEGNAVYPQPDSGGFLTMISLALVLVIITLGIILAPFLLIEEKETHTIEALLVSPASYTQVVAGKAIAGMFYCLAAAAVVLLINHGLITHWSIVLLTVIFGSLFAVSLGLFIGTLFDNPTNLNMWGGGADRGPDGAYVLFHNSWAKLSSLHPGYAPLAPIRSDDKPDAVVVRQRHFPTADPVKPGDIDRVHPPAARPGGLAPAPDGQIIPLFTKPLRSRGKDYPAGACRIRESALC